MQTSRNSGISAVGEIPWGAHFCQFYRDQSDLTETLVPYFEAGLRANESCLWVTSRKLEATEAEARMVDAMPEFKKYLSKGQMEIVSISDWYKNGGGFDADTVLQGWIDKEADSRRRGFEGLRLTGDTIWVERSGWHDFMDYERKVNASFAKYNMVALCTYCMDECSAEDVIDVCCHHQFALARRFGNWELLESSSLKIAKEKLLHMNQQLESRVQERTAELQAALQSRDEFLAMLGHELRNPLAPIRSATEVIRALVPEVPQVEQSAQIVHRQVSHLTRLIDDLLDVARLTRGQIQIEQKVVSLRGVIDLAVEQSAPFIDQRRHALSVVYPSVRVKVLADTNRLTQVFGNLLHNAAKYTPDGGEVGIAAKVVDNQVVVTVTDNGAGIPPPMLDSVFELFAQLPRSLARSDGGLGIGLTLAKRIVDMHGGSIQAFSDGPDCGTSFAVTLPLALPEECESLPPSPSLRAAAAPVQSQRKVLLVDDNEDGRTCLATLLSIYGHEVDIASDGADALAKTAIFKPDIVMLDIGLPDMDGYEVARRLRADEATARTRLVAITGYGQKADVQSAHEAGFDAHILKPARIEDVCLQIGLSGS